MSFFENQTKLCFPNNERELNELVCIRFAHYLSEVFKYRQRSFFGGSGGGGWGKRFVNSF